jgi:tRNA-dihydrouridine synthase
MDYQDKLFEQIKEAERNAENQDFPAMEKVWSRLEEKLDKIIDQQKKAAENSGVQNAGALANIAAGKNITVPVSVASQYSPEEFAKNRKQIELKGEFVGIREMRKHVAWYTAGMRHSAGLRRESNTIESYEALEALLSRLA